MPVESVSLNNVSQMTNIRSVKSPKGNLSFGIGQKPPITLPGKSKISITNVEKVSKALTGNIISAGKLLLASVALLASIPVLFATCAVAPLFGINLREVMRETWFEKHDSH